MKEKDRLEIQVIVEAAVREALTVDWTIERRRDERTGQPLAVPELKTERVFLPSVLVQLLPYHEGALRGLQEDFGKANLTAHGENLNALVALIEQAQPVLKKLAWFADLVERQQQQIANVADADKHIAHRPTPFVKPGDIDRAFRLPGELK